jgi:hypothetical protein
LQEKEKLVPLYLKVRRGVKERLEREAKERGYRYLSDFAGEMLEKALGEPRSTQQTRPEAIQKLIGLRKQKTCRYLSEDGYCSAWELPKEEAERIYGEEANELFEPRVVERSDWLTTVKVEEYGLKPNPHLCFSCPYYEAR